MTLAARCRLVEIKANLSSPRHLAAWIAGLGLAATTPIAFADFTVDLGSGSLAGGEYRFVEVEAGGTMIGFTISLDYAGTQSDEWVTDTTFWIEDPEDHKCGCGGDGMCGL